MIRVSWMVLLAVTLSSIGWAQEKPPTPNQSLLIGWGSTGITPESAKAIMAGTNSVRFSSAIGDPLTATALAIQAPYQTEPSSVILISCDLRNIPESYLEGVRTLLKKTLPDVPSENIVINATHSHTAPPLGSKDLFGVEFPGMDEAAYEPFVIPKIAAAAEMAWKNRKPGGISFGLSHAVVGHNRLITNNSGKSKMYGKTNTKNFSHVEGYEDHSVNILCTWDLNRELTGMVLNVASPAQVSVEPKISADFWHPARLEIKKRWGNQVFILPQCSAAGDQSPKALIDVAAEERMQQLTGQNRQESIAQRLADAIDAIFPVLQENILWNPPLAQTWALVPLSLRLLSEKDAQSAKQDVKRYEGEYQALLEQQKADPALVGQRAWYIETTAVYRRYKQALAVLERFALQKKDPHLQTELRVIRLGDIAIATNPFELYVDYGMQIKGRSKAVQTFIVQLAGPGSYVPTKRSIEGEGYGALPSSTKLGPEGGNELVEWTVQAIEALWPELSSVGHDKEVQKP